MAGKEPKTNSRGEILAAAKKFYQDKQTPNELENLAKDGSFCIHDLSEVLPQMKKSLMYYSMRSLLSNEALMKMSSMYPCKTLSKSHVYYKFNDPFKKPTPLEQEVANDEKTRTVDIKTGRIVEVKHANSIKNETVSLGTGRIREISIKITDGELHLCIKKG